MKRRGSVARTTRTSGAGDDASTVDGLQLIKGQFGVGHEVFLSIDTPSPDSASDLMTCLIQDCEVGHRGITT